MNDRLSPNTDDDAFPVSAIEIAFAIPVFLTFDDQGRIHDAVERIIKRPCNQLKHGVHWLAGVGSKPQWSQSDALFLGKTPDPSAPASGEPTYDDEIFHMESAARAFIDEDERRKTEARRAKYDPFGRPKIVCLCGSTRFVDTFNEWRQRLTLENCIVLAIEIVATQRREQDPQHSDPETKKRLDILHLRKIDLADEVMILNVGGYVGESTRKEIEYAKRRKKPIVWLEQESVAVLPAGQKD